MRPESFSLRPFPTTGPMPDLEITGTICRQAHALVIEYYLRGRVAELAIPAHADFPVRKAGLWKATCLEFFFAPRNSSGYWEFNLSPAGHWNAYRFSGYRQGMQEEPALEALPMTVWRQSDSLRLSLELDLGRLVPVDQVVEVAISAVIGGRDGTTTYWALAHCGTAPDFHHRDGFVLVLG